MCQAPSRRRGRRCGSAPPFFDFYLLARRKGATGVLTARPQLRQRAGLVDAIIRTAILER